MIMCWLYRLLSVRVVQKLWAIGHFWSKKVPGMSQGSVLKCSGLVRSLTMTVRNLLLCAIGKVFAYQSASDWFANTPSYLMESLTAMPALGARSRLCSASSCYYGQPRMQAATYAGSHIRRESSANMLLQSPTALLEHHPRCIAGTA